MANHEHHEFALLEGSEVTVTEKPILRLHEEAAASFNAKAEQLASLIASEEDLGEAPSTVPPEAYVEHEITEADIIPDGIVKHHADVANRTTGSFFHDKDRGWVGLEGAAYQQLVELADLMQRRSELREYLSRSSIEDELFKWLKAWYLRADDFKLC